MGSEACVRPRSKGRLPVERDLVCSREPPIRYRENGALFHRAGDRRLRIIAGVEDPKSARFDEAVPVDDEDLEAALRALIEIGRTASDRHDPRWRTALEAVASRDDDPLERELIEVCADHCRAGGIAADVTDARSWCLQERAELLLRVAPKLEAARRSTGQDVVPLAALGIHLHELWRVYLPLAMVLDDLARRHVERSPGRAFLLAINAPPGCGKSTLVQLLKFLLVEIAAADGGARRVCIEVSQDDFYLTHAERLARGIPSRVEMEGMDVGLCRDVLSSLVDRTRAFAVEIPRFSKALDDREPSGTPCVEPVDIVLFEGWRVGIDHPLYAPLVTLPDFTLCIDVDLDAARTWKFEQSRRDAERAGVAFDAEGLARTWDRSIAPLVRAYGGRVRERADLVFGQGPGHAIVRMSGRLERLAHERRLDVKRRSRSETGSGR